MTEEIFMVTEVDCSTGEQIQRPMTNEEIDNWNNLRAESLRLKAEQEAVEQAKLEAKSSALAKLTALGLTEEEIAAITN